MIQEPGVLVLVFLFFLLCLVGREISMVQLARLESLFGILWQRTPMSLGIGATVLGASGGVGIAFRTGCGSTWVL